MIVALLEIIGGTVVNVFGALLGALTVVIPDSIYTAIAWVFKQVFYFQGWFPVATMLSALSFYLLIWIIMYSVKLIIMIVNMIPGVNVQLPNHKKEKDQDYWTDYYAGPKGEKRFFKFLKKQGYKI